MCRQTKLLAGVAMSGIAMLAACTPEPEEATALDTSSLFSQQTVAESTASTGMVTGTTGARAQQTGVDILKGGGTAADAAVATAMSQICLAAGSWVSYAGLMNVVYYEAASGKVYNMNASFNTVAGETDPASIPQPDFAKDTLNIKLEPNGRTVLVPGFLKGAEALNKRFGRLSLADVVAPSVKCAEQGITWNEGLAVQFDFRKGELSRDPDTKAVFTKADGSPYQAGDTFKQPQLAKTLRAFGQQGSDYIYKGPWAKKLVSKVQALGGKLSMQDMESYDVIWDGPVKGTYHGYDVYVHGMPAAGGVNILEALKMAELANLSEMGHYGESPQALFWMSHITRIGNTLSFVPDIMGNALNMDLSLASRLKPETSEKLWQMLRAGNFPGAALPNHIPAHSDGVVVVDRWGNIASMVHTINTVSWGTTGLNIDGISIADAAALQVPVVAAITPGERLPDPTSPGLVLKEGKPLMGFASIGAGLLQRSVASLISVMDFGMTPQQAINAPAWGHSTLSLDGNPGVTHFGAGDLKPSMIQTLKEMGLEIEENNSTRGYWIGIQIDPKTGALQGGSPRSFELTMGGRAVGY